MSVIFRLVKEGRMRPALIYSYNTWKKFKYYITWNLSAFASIGSLDHDAFAISSRVHQTQKVSNEFGTLILNKLFIFSYIRVSR